jgi:hypothetical protein
MPSTKKFPADFFLRSNSKNKDDHDDASTTMSRQNSEHYMDIKEFTFMAPKLTLSKSACVNNQQNVFGKVPTFFRKSSNS